MDIYRETFGKGPGVGSGGPGTGWTVGHNTDSEAPGTWHQNILGHRGIGAPLEWHETGGRDGGAFARSASPWYFDDNHGEFYWFHIVLRANETKELGIGDADLRNATVTMSLRGGLDGRSGFYSQPVLYNWALTAEPLQDMLVDGKWHQRQFVLTTDEFKWSQLGLLNGGLAGKIRVVQSGTVAEGTLDGILGGKHYNFGFLLCNVDARDLPSGYIDIDEFRLTAP